MEALYVQPGEERVKSEEEDCEKDAEQDGGETESFSLVVSSTEEETDEDSEPEPPPAIRRKVSFADAFGLNLVSVKEFDNAEVTESEVSWSDGRKVVQSTEEIYLSCLFTVPSSTEELDQRLCEQMVELESIELLPGTTTLRGIIRVVNLCYDKTVFARVTLDRWSSYFDLLAEYVPGSSDRKTDRFTFRYTVVPPFEKEGTRVEFCIRYETPMGTFWANNKGMNYVMFCHQKAQVKEHVIQTEEETSSYKCKRSCLKPNRNGDTMETTMESINSNVDAADMEWAHKAEKISGETTSLHRVDQNPWVESAKRRRRAIRLARLQDLCQRVQQQPKGFSHDSTYRQRVSQQVSAARGDAAIYLCKSQKMQSSESPQVLTYHEIPLLTLDWNSHTPKQPGTADVNDILTGIAKVTLSKESEENTPSVNDMWESFSKTRHDSNTKEPSVSDAWQVFLNGPSCKHHSDVPESEWLQTAASVLPSNDKEPQIQYSKESQEFGEATDAPTTLQTLAECQLLSDTCETLPGAVALNVKDDQLAEACVSSPGDDNTATQDLPQRSQTNSATDTPQEFKLKRAPPLSKDTTDSPSECRRHKDWEQESKGIIRTEGRGEGEPFALHTPDLITSSGELETTEMTVMPEIPNASIVDTISPDPSQDGGLSLSGEREVTDTAHNAVDDILAFRETIWKETTDRARFVFPASRQGEEDEIMMNYTAKAVPKAEEIFRPQERKECNMPQRYGDKIQHEEFGQSLNREIKENKTETSARNAVGFDSEQICGGNLEKHKNILMDTDEHSPSNYHQMIVTEKQVMAIGTQSKETEEKTDKGSKLIKILDEMQLQHEDQSSSLPMEEHRQSSSVQVNKNLNVEKREHLAPKQTEQYSDQKSVTGQHKLIYDRKVKQQKEISTSAGLNLIDDTLEAKVCKIRQISCPTDKYDLNYLEEVKPSLTDPQQDIKNQKYNSSRDGNLEKVMAIENGAKRDTSAEHKPETSRGTKQFQSKKDEKVCVGRLRKEAITELMGNAESPQGENKNAWKEQKSSAEVKTSTHFEDNKMAEGAKDPITVENSGALDATQSRTEQMFIERFAANLVGSIWEEVFTREVQLSIWHTNTIGDIRGQLTDSAEGCSLIDKKILSDPYDSGVFSLTGFSADSALNLCQVLEQALMTESNDYSPRDRIRSLTMTEGNNSPFEFQTDLDSNTHLSPIVHGNELMCDPTQSLCFPKDQGNSSQIKARLVSHQEKDFEIEGSILADTENFNQSSHLSKKHHSSSKKSNAIFWWNILYTISHLTRLIICTLLVGGFFVVVFLYDFPAFFALYIFSTSWWIFQWKRHQVTTGRRAK